MASQRSTPWKRDTAVQELPTCRWLGETQPRNIRFDEPTMNQPDIFVCKVYLQNKLKHVC